MFICFILFLLNSENKRTGPSIMSKLKKYHLSSLDDNKPDIIALFRFLLTLSDGKLCKAFFKMNFPTLVEGSYSVCLSSAIGKLEAALASVSSEACEIEHSLVPRFNTQDFAQSFLIAVMKELSQK